MATREIVIKKYGNRRLYDTHQSRYVNVSDIARLIREGREVKVVDASSGEDLTRAILMQIIAEDNRESTGGLPTEVLKQLVVASDQIGSEFLAWYLKSAFETYHRVQHSFAKGLAGLESVAASPIKSVRNLFKEAQSGDSTIEVAKLRKRLAEVERQVNAPKARDTTKKKKGRNTKTRRSPRSS